MKPWITNNWNSISEKESLKAIDFNGDFDYGDIILSPDKEICICLVSPYFVNTKLKLLK